MRVVIQYERELLARAEVFREHLAKTDPGNQDLVSIDADIAQRQARIQQLEHLASSPETQRLIEHLKTDGYAVYDLLGKPPAALRTEGMYFSFVNHALEHVTATPSLVAFKKRRAEFFLSGSRDSRFKRHLELLEEEKARVERKYPGAGLIVRVGKPSEWAELAFKHFNAPNGGVSIFGSEYGHNFTWADAYKSDQAGAFRAVVGGDEADGLDIDFRLLGDVDYRLGLAPLVEIPRKLAA